MIRPISRQTCNFTCLWYLLLKKYSNKCLPLKCNKFILKEWNCLCFTLYYSAVEGISDHHSEMILLTLTLFSLYKIDTYRMAKVKKHDSLLCDVTTLDSRYLFLDDGILIGAAFYASPIFMTNWWDKNTFDESSEGETVFFLVELYS